MKPQAWKKKGAILVYVVLIMALLIVFGVGMIFLANHNSNTTVNEVYAEQAYLTARSGLRSTMTMMEEDTAKTSDVASQLKTAKTLTSSVDLTANKLGTVSVQVSCTDTDCTILQIDSTGTYQGVSQTVTGYMKNSAPEITKPLMILNEINVQSNSSDSDGITDFDNNVMNKAKDIKNNLPLHLGDTAYQSIDASNLGSSYTTFDCSVANGSDIEIKQKYSRLDIYKANGVWLKTFNADSSSVPIVVLYNAEDIDYISIKATTVVTAEFIIVVADSHPGIELQPYNGSNWMQAWIVAPGNQVNIEKNKSYSFNLKGGVICKNFSWENGSKWAINGYGQDNILSNTAFMNLYNQLAGGGWTRSYEKP